MNAPKLAWSVGRDGWATAQAYPPGLTFSVTSGRDGWHVQCFSGPGDGSVWSTRYPDAATAQVACERWAWDCTAYSCRPNAPLHSPV